MLSNFKRLALAVLLTACGDKSQGRFEIGERIDPTNPTQLQMVQTPDATQFYIYDPYAHRINFVDATHQTLQFSRDLGENSKGRLWLATERDGYYFDVKDNVLSLTTQEGESSRQIVQMAGSIRSYAADFEQGYFAFIDDYFSIAVMKMSDSGEIQSSWRGGAMIDGMNVIAGEMLEGGHLVLVTDKNQLVDIDLAATLQNQAWSYAPPVTMSTNKPNWVGRVEGAADRVLVLDNSALRLLDRTTGAVLATQTLPGSYSVVPSKQGVDHVYYYDPTTDKTNIIYANSADTLRLLPVKMNGTSPAQTYFTPTRLTVRTTSSKVLQIEIRSNETLVATSQDIQDSNALIGLGNGMAAAMFDSPLGYIRLYNLDAGTEQNFNGFNLQILQGK